MDKTEVAARECALEFARTWDTPQVRRGISLAEQGVITWKDLATVFIQANNKVQSQGLS
jgi:hypothetical protein